MKSNRGTLFLITLTMFFAVSYSLAQEQSKVVKSYTFDNSRNMRFGEILLSYPDGMLAFNTTGLGEVPAGIWDDMDPDKLAAQFKAQKVLLNGPMYYMADTVTLWLGETIDFGGINARWDAALDPTLVVKFPQTSEPYKVFEPKLTQRNVFTKGNPVYELVDPDGNNYVLHARSESIPMETLATLDMRMKKLPKDWQFRTRVLTEDLVIEFHPSEKSFVVKDEFNQYYAKPNTGSAAADEAQFMFVQSAENLIADTEAKTIRLVNVNQQTVYFSDRPERLAGSIKMDVYMENWSSKSGDNNFAEDPPNASLSVYQPGQSDNSVVIIEILNPVIDGSDLVYSYNIIKGNMPVNGGPTTLFIDLVGRRGVGLGHRGPGI